MTFLSACHAAPPDPFHSLVEWFAQPAAKAGPLLGLTFVAKDCLDLAGRAPGCGLPRGQEGPAPDRNAEVLDQLASLGAGLIGMAQMTPLAFEPSGANAALGRPVNPHGSRHVCGGSSSGSAVAVAAGMVDFAIGTDTGGSVRIPAHCCGVAGWKPSFGTISTRGVMPLAPSLDCVGFLARNMEILGRLANAFRIQPAGTVKRLVIAADAMAAATPGIRIACRAGLERTSLPVREVAALPLIEACDKPVFALLEGEAWRANRERAASEGFDAGLARRLGKGAAIADADLDAARQALARLARTGLDAVLGEDEVLVLPTMPAETPLVAACTPGDPAFSARALYGLSAYTRFVNGLGLPAISLPAGLDSQGMPVGLQLVGRAGRDADLIAAASRLAPRLPAEIPLTPLANPASST